MSTPARQFVAVIETQDDKLNREYWEFDAHSSSEAQAYAMDELADNQRIVSVWERVL